MKIIINGKFLSQKITGVQRFAREILLELDNIVEPGMFEIAVEKNFKESLPYKNIELAKIGAFRGNLWEQISLPRYVKKQKAECLSLCNSSPLLCSNYITVFDMKIKAHPEFFSWRFKTWYNFLFSKSLMRSKIIFTDSEFAKKEIIKYYPKCSPSKIKVVYCGWQHFFRIPYDELALSKRGLKKGNYFFAMSSLDPNKNFSWIATQAKLNPTFLFVVSGSVNSRVFSKDFGFDVPENMKLLGYVSDSEAKTLMRDCNAFLFPSIYEGFGIPPLEAIASGCNAVILSNIEVMHEVYGDYAYYIDEKFSIKSFKKSSSIACSTNLLSKYSWSKAATIILQSIQSGINE